jgi:hypothetical protein
MILEAFSFVFKKAVDVVLGKRALIKQYQHKNAAKALKSLMKLYYELNAAFGNSSGIDKANCVSRQTKINIKYLNVYRDDLYELLLLLPEKQRTKIKSVSRKVERQMTDKMANCVSYFHQNIKENYIFLTLGDPILSQELAELIELLKKYL